MTDVPRKEYFYHHCLPCKVKVHIDSNTCWKCGQKVEDMVYGSENPNDAMYSYALNKVEKCFNCYNVQKGTVCRYAYCFGTGRGDCESCNRFEGTRFNCCQNEQKKEETYEGIAEFGYPNLLEGFLQRLRDKGKVIKFERETESKYRLIG